MYELKCPSCQHGVKTSFVRVGAVTDCPSCKTRYRIDDKNIRRITKQKPGASALKAEEVLRDRVGLSGLSEVMQREAGAAQTQQRWSHSPEPSAPNHRPDRPDQPGQPGQAAQNEDPEQTRTAQLARERRRRRHTRALYATAAVLIGSVGLVGAGLLMTQFGGQPWVNNQVSQMAQPTPTEMELPLRAWQPMIHEGWSTLRPRPYVRPSFASDIVLSNGRVETDAEDNHEYLAELTTERYELIDHARLELIIVDADGLQLARARQTVSMITRTSPREVRVPIPAELWDKHADYHVEGWVDIRSEFERPTRIDPEQVDIHDIAGTADARVLLSMVNPMSRPLRSVVFVLTGLDVDDQPVAAWRVEWREGVEPGENLEFHVDLPLPEGTLRPVSWRVEAAGDKAEPEPAE